MGDYLSVGQVADLLNVPVYRVRYQIRKGGIKYTKVGWGIAIHSNQLPILRKIFEE